MDTDVDASPSYFDPEDLSSRQLYRRYRKRQLDSNISSVSEFSEAVLLYDGDNIQRWPNAALLIDEIKREVNDSDVEGFEGGLAPKTASSKRRFSTNSHTKPELHSHRKPVQNLSSPIKAYPEDDVLLDNAESTYKLFASLFESALQGLMTFPNLILHFEETCRSISESIRNSSGRHRVVEDKFMQQNARLLLDEAASWSLLWYLFGKANEVLPEDLIVIPTTSHQQACHFVMEDHSAQLCLRVVLWLEGLASEALDLEMKVRGSHVGSYLPSSGVWHHTQRFLKKKNNDPAIIQHLDFDAPTRELAELLPDDKKQDENLLEDIWTLLRAGRLEEACELCRSAGQPWRAASLCPFGGLDMFPSVQAMQRNGKTRILQAIELESGIGRQWRLWRWACYVASEKIAEQDDGKYEIAVYAAQCSNLKRILPVCKDWESACWAMAKAWLDFQVDSYLTQFQQNKVEERNSGSNILASPASGDPNLLSNGPESWPGHVLDQQPRNFQALLQKLHSSEIVYEDVARACREHHRQIEMDLMLGDISHLLDLLWSWISPSENEQDVSRPHGDPQIIRFGAHAVLVLRFLLDGDVKDVFREKLNAVGDRILHMYAMFLFSKQHEDLVGIYASQLARHLCIDLFVSMMELKLKDSVHVKYKLFLSAIQCLPFSPEDDDRASFEDIIERVLSRSRGSKIAKYVEISGNVVEKHRLESLEKAMAVQWLCFSPPSTIKDFEIINAKLLIRSLMHSNILFREFALISMWRVPDMPIGAHMLLSYLAEPLKQPRDALLSFDENVVAESLHEFEDWREYYSCDATFRNWLKVDLQNSSISPDDLSVEEKERAITAARETLDSSLSLLLRDGTPWLNASNDSEYDLMEHIYLELHATAMLCLPSGDCMRPDATLCTTLSSALYSSVGEEDVLKRELMVNVVISSRDEYCIDVTLRCLAINGDGLGIHEANDGGLLASIMAAGFKGELSRFQSGVTMEVSRLDSWYSDLDGSHLINAPYVIKGLCRRCCIPEMILRCMQVSICLAESGDSLDCRDVLIDLVASNETGTLHLFSPQQLQEFLLYERECLIYKMEIQEEQPSGNA